MSPCPIPATTTITPRAKIDYAQKNSKCIDKDETVNHMIRECNKLAQKKYKASEDWVGKVIDWKLCKKLKLDHADKHYMNKPESVRENETHKVF